jgi:glutaredoxin 3
MGASSSSPATAEMKDFITDQIGSNKVVVFSKSYCPYCIRTKDLFKKEFSGINVVYHELDKRNDGPAMQGALHSMSGQRAVPSVWIGGKFVGGNSETQSAFQSGELQTMLGLN